MKSGVDSVIIATGGIEQNGPYIVTGKHNYVLKGTTEAIARKLGKTLVAPIIAFVPEGDIDPPSLHMKYPGTISLSEETYERLLTEICTSFKTHGFKRIVLIGDSGGNQAGMKAVAEKLNAAWKGTPRVIFVLEYYTLNLAEWVKLQGINQQPEGLHDDFAMSAQLLSVDPRTIRMTQRIKAGNFRINGVDLAPADKTIAIGRKIIEYRAEQTVAAIRKHEQAK
jgi:creatinine amidohydrolase/Fe(II)-dependent formamide hydrolase-like protein